MSKKTKIFVGIVVAIIVVILAVNILGKDDSVVPPSTGPLSSTTGIVPLPGASTATPSGADEFSAILSTINRISIDTTLFQNAAYKLLRDVPVFLGTDTVGRVNPFAPIGTDVSAPAATAPVQIVQTLQAGKITRTSAEFGAQVTMTDTVPVSIVFEYGTTDTFDSATAPITITKGGTVLATATKLLPATTYYVRAVAVRGSETIPANTTSFLTIK